MPSRRDPGQTVPGTRSRAPGTGLIPTFATLQGGGFLPCTGGRAALDGIEHCLAAEAVLERGRGIDPGPNPFQQGDELWV